MVLFCVTIVPFVLDFLGLNKKDFCVQANSSLKLNRPNTQSLLQEPEPKDFFSFYYFREKRGKMSSASLFPTLFRKIDVLLRSLPKHFVYIDSYIPKKRLSVHEFLLSSSGLFPW